MIAHVLLAAGVAAGVTAGPSPAPLVARDLAAALGPLARKVEASTRIRGPVLGSDGQFVATLADGREVGIFAMRYRWAFARAPVFWINLASGDGIGQEVLTPRGGRLVEDHLPNDWIASDYMAARKPGRDMSFLALNPRRVVTTAQDGRRVVAKAPFAATHPVTTNLLARTTWWVADPATVRAMSVMVYRVKDAGEAEQLAGAVEAYGLSAK